MSLYKPEEEQTTTMVVKLLENNTIICIDFDKDCGKFGTEESIASFTLTADKLLKLLIDNEE